MLTTVWHELDDRLLQSTLSLFSRHCKDDPKIAGYGGAEAGRGVASSYVVCTSDIVDTDIPLPSREVCAAGRFSRTSRGASFHAVNHLSTV
jgi:hypothetical protein